MKRVLFCLPFILLLAACGREEALSAATDPVMTASPVTGFTATPVSSPVANSTATAIPSLPATSAPIAAASPTPVSFSADQYSVLFEMAFDSAYDLNYFDTIVGLPTDRAGAAVRDGMVHFGGAPIKAGMLKFHPAIGTGIYFRYKLLQPSTCFSYSFAVWGANDAGYDGCSGRPLDIWPPPGADPSQYTLEEGGQLDLEVNDWVDQFIWMERKQDAGGEQIVFYGFSWKNEDPSAYLMAKVNLPGAELLDDYVVTLDCYTGQFGIDFIQVISDDPMAFLWNNSASFEKNSVEMLDFFSLSPGVTQLEPGSGDGQSVTSEPTAYVDLQAELESLFESMLHNDDLPVERGLFETWRTVQAVQDGLRLSQRFIQQTRSGGGGLWLEVILSESESEHTLETLHAALITNPAQQVDVNAPQVGDASLSYRGIPFDHFVFTRGKLMLELKCNSVFTGYHFYCAPQNLAAIAQKIFDRLPQSYDLSQLISAPVTWDEQQPGLIERMEVRNEDGTQSLCWTARDWLPSLEIAAFSETAGAVVDIRQSRNILNLGIGESCLPLEGLSDGSYTFWLLVDGQIAAETYAIYRQGE